MATNNSINNKISDNSFSVTKTLFNDPCVSSVIHSDSSSTSSHANIAAQAGGGSGGDAFIRFNVTNGQDYSFGIDNSASDVIKITDDASPSAGNTLTQIASTYGVLYPLSSAFSAYNNASQNEITGDGTVYTFSLNTEIFDQNSNFSSSTFTAPITGKYLLNGFLTPGDISAAHTDMNITISTSNRDYVGSTCSPAAIRNSVNIIEGITTCIADMDIGDTAVLKITIFNGAKVNDCSNSSTANAFHGALIC